MAKDGDSGSGGGVPMGAKYGMSDAELEVERQRRLALTGAEGREALLETRLRALLVSFMRADEYALQNSLSAGASAPEVYEMARFALADTLVAKFSALVTDDQQSSRTLGEAVTPENIARSTAIGEAAYEAKKRECITKLEATIPEERRPKRPGELLH